MCVWPLVPTSFCVPSLNVMQYNRVLLPPLPHPIISRYDGSPTCPHYDVRLPDEPARRRVGGGGSSRLRGRGPSRPRGRRRAALHHLLGPCSRREPRLLEHRQARPSQAAPAGPYHRPAWLHGAGVRAGGSPPRAAGGPRVRPRPPGRTARPDRPGPRRPCGTPALECAGE